MSEQSYIVRIYRREKRGGMARRAQDRVAITGVVENVSDGLRQGFNDIDQLWAILAKTGRARPKAAMRKTPA
jgi:hypothetical protein